MVTLHVHVCQCTTWFIYLLLSQWFVEKMSSGKDLLAAIKLNDVERALAILKESETLDLNYQTESRDGTALFYACCKGQLKVVQKLLDLGAGFDATCYLCTPIHGACDNNQPSISRLLLSHGANVNGQNLGGDTPCHLAAYRGTMEIVSILVDHGADVNIINNKGITAMNEAYSGGHITIAEYLAARTQKKRDISHLLRRSSSDSGVAMATYDSPRRAPLTVCRTDASNSKIGYHGNLSKHHPDSIICGARSYDNRYCPEWLPFGTHHGVYGASFHTNYLYNSYHDDQTSKRPNRKNNSQIITAEMRKGYRTLDRPKLQSQYSCPPETKICNSFSKIGQDSTDLCNWNKNSPLQQKSYYIKDKVF